MPDGPRGVARIVAAVEPFDEVERSYQAAVLAWLASTSDVYRRVKPATPPMHLVAYTVGVSDSRCGDPGRHSGTGVVAGPEPVHDDDRLVSHHPGVMPLR